MASTLPTATPCCVTTCTDPVTVSVPGAAGTNGAAGAAGAAGTASYTTTTANFTMPAEGADVSVAVVTSLWMTATQKVYVGNCGYMEVRSKADATHVTLRNSENTASGLYVENVAPGTVVASGNSVSPAGIQGAAGAGAGVSFIIANNLSEGVPATMRTNLGLGTVAVKAAGVANTNVAPVDDAAFTNGEMVRATAAGIESVAAATARTALGLGTVAVKNFGVANTNALIVDTGAFVATECVFATAAGVETFAPLGSRALLGNVLPRYGILGSATSVDLNIGVTDTAIVMEGSLFRIDKVMVMEVTTNISVTNATGGLFTAVGGGGTALAVNQVLSVITAKWQFVDMTLAATLALLARTDATLYFRVGTAQGAACKADVRILGWRLD